MKSVYPTYTVTSDSDTNNLGMAIAAAMLAHRACPDLNLKGYWFCSGEGEDCGYKRKCDGFFNACTEFVRAAKMSRKDIEMFKNMNGDLALKLI